LQFDTRVALCARRSAPEFEATGGILVGSRAELQVAWRHEGGTADSGLSFKVEGNGARERHNAARPRSTERSLASPGGLFRSPALVDKSKALSEFGSLIPGGASSPREIDRADGPDSS
jgi:hypothetical protein